MKRKFFRTEFKLVVLSENKPVDGLNLRQLGYVIYDGDCSGELDLVSVQELTSREAVAALVEQGSCPEFFHLDKEGNDE